MAPISFLARSCPSMRRRSFKSISTFVYLHQEAQLEQPPVPSATPLPPNPASGSPLYRENWRSPLLSVSASDAAVIPFGNGFLHRASRMQPQDAQSLMNQFADWMTSQRWEDIKQLFEFWIRCLDKNGKPNKPDVGLYNQYLRANLMIGASAGELLNLVAQIDDYGTFPNTASFNIVLKAMEKANEALAAEELIERMLQIGIDCKEALPDDESCDLVIGMLLSNKLVDSALKYIDMALKSGCMLSLSSFTDCVRSCARSERLDTLVSIIERCKEMDQNKFVCPPWAVCKYIADVAMRTDKSELTYYALEFMAKCIDREEKARHPVHLSGTEGLVFSALGTASRTYSSKLLNASWSVLNRSLQKKQVPSAASYLAKMYAHTEFGNLQEAFSTLHEFERAHGESNLEEKKDLFSPFHSLNPLVRACSKNGFEALDSVYYQLESLSRADPPYKSIAALNCIILGYANLWDLDRAYQTFNAINSSFGLTPNIHSHNGLICAFGKLGKRDEAAKVLERCVGLGVKPNVTTYSLLVKAHLMKRDQKVALAVIDEMVNAGFEPSKEMLKQVRRRCIREMDSVSDEKVQSLATQFKIQMGTEVGRDMLFNLQYKAITKR